MSNLADCRLLTEIFMSANLDRHEANLATEIFFSLSLCVFVMAALL